MTAMQGLALVGYCAANYLAAGLAINLAYHRALSHRSLTLWKPLERSTPEAGRRSE